MIWEEFKRNFVKECSSSINEFQFQYVWWDRRILVCEWSAAKAHSLKTFVSQATQQILLPTCLIQFRLWTQVWVLWWGWWWVWWWVHPGRCHEASSAPHRHSRDPGQAPQVSTPFIRSWHPVHYYQSMLEMLKSHFLKYSKQINTNWRNTTFNLVRKDCWLKQSMMTLTKLISRLHTCPRVPPLLSAITTSSMAASTSTPTSPQLRSLADWSFGEPKLAELPLDRCSPLQSSEQKSHPIS